MQNCAPLYNAMLKFKEKSILPFDVPGHKRGRGVPELQEFLGKDTIAYDINSMPELDNLNYPNGVIKDAQDLMAKAFDADHAFFIVNGTTLAVHSMILSVCSPGDKILLPRNVHKSVINALVLCDAMPVYMQSEISCELGFTTAVTLETVKTTIEQNPDAKAILLINPTYYGVCCELEEITTYAHSKGLIVIVDEAHGAHFNFNKALPKSAMECGADMSAVSIHKTGGALTQASAVLLKEGRITAEHVQSVLNIFHTTSASYLLMTSLDIARRNLAINGEKMLDEIIKVTMRAKEEINKFDGLYCYSKEIVGTPGIWDLDETKLGINVSQLGLTGYEVYDILLYDYNIQMELADTYNVLAIVSLGDDDNSLSQLTAALKDIALTKKRDNAIEQCDRPLKNPHVRVTPRQAFYSKQHLVPLKDAAGCISAESIMVYPPGIPIIAPGEEFTEEMIEHIEFLKTQHTKLTDMTDSTLERVLIIDNSCKGKNL